MSTKRPKPELSAHFIRDKRLLEATDTAKYNARLKELDLPDDYAVYGYEQTKGGQPAAYWVCKQGVGKCPECDTPYLEDAIASVSESKLTHYCRVAIPHKGKKPTYETHPATLYLRRIRWRCYNCYSKFGTYNAKMQDDSQLVDGNEKLTQQLKTFLGQQAMHIEVNTLAEIFAISPHTVKNCFDKVLAKYDEKRDWDNISTLGLYTVTLNVQGQQTNFCLCVDVDAESLIELFPYEDTKVAANFVNGLKKQRNIQRIFTSIDSAAFDFAKTNFPIKTVMVDRLDVRKRLLNGLETVKKGNDDSQYFPILRRHWKLLNNVEEAIPVNSKDYVFLKEVLDAFPRVGVAYGLKEAGMDIYRKHMGQSKLVNDWILSDKHDILPYEQLEQCMIQAQEPVVRFAEQYNGVDRSRYEKAVLAAERPLINYIDLTGATKSVLWSRAASLQMIRARVLYGAAMMANCFAAQEPNEKSYDECAIHEAMRFSTVSLKETAAINKPAVKTETTPEIYLHNFRIPLSIYPTLLSYGLTEYRGTLLYLRSLRINNNEVKKMFPELNRNPENIFPKEHTIVRRNERSWAIELITKINKIAENNDLAIKRAGGETTISVNRGNTMFPDVVLYGDEKQSVILQGWELKMPDVPIENETFIKDAQRKAIALNLNSCLIWNFTYAVLYVRERGDAFKKLKQWDDTNYIHTRQDVEIYRADWEKQLEKVITEINGYFVSGQFRNISIGKVITESTITTLIQRNKDIIASGLKKAAFRDSRMAAYIDNWWLNVKAEYAQDESDKYNAYAKSIILNWTNRIVFAHIIKYKQNGAMLVDGIDYDKSPNDANGIFGNITSKCDFYNVFSPIPYNEVLPELSWQDFVELSNFLRSNGIDHLNQEALQNILEGTVATSKREINGQFTTPTELAKILVRLTVKDWTDAVLDCCCGTGTIPKEVIHIKKSQMTAKDAVESVWACDKNNYPLQVANISMTEPDTINIANRLFKHNALTLSVGEKVEVVNPKTGVAMTLLVPSFGSVVSNLPFVPFEIIPGDDKDNISKLSFSKELDGRSDLYGYIAIKIADVLKPDGTLGIIVSNSWLGTKAGMKFVNALKQRYNIKQVHISGKGRWFKNADVVTTIIVLEKRKDDERPHTDFWLWNLSLEQLSENSEDENTLINSALLSSELNRNIARLSTYSESQMEGLLNLNICYNALFHDVDWLLDVKNKIIPIKKVYHVFRGSRRGWDALFYPRNGEHNIEPKYLKRVLLNARNVTELVTVADRDAFCCNVSMEELKHRGDLGALRWIEKFADQRNGVGKPLPMVLKRKGMQWYELQDNEVAEVFTAMNPDQRLFFAKFETPSFVNQRLIGLTHREAYPDEELNHALINSMFTMFYIEASGFGRGLGVLDVNKDSIENCYMLNPDLVDANNRQRILQSFNNIKARKIMKVEDELKDEERIAFEHTVLQSFGIDDYFDKIKSSLLSMQATRKTAKEL